MLMPSLHSEFGNFRFAFEATDTPHCYRPKVFNSFPSASWHFLPRDSPVTFRSHDDRYPLPNPTLLQVHTAIANVLHATGRGELVERIQAKYAGSVIRGLAKDGSTDIGQILSVSALSLLASAEGCSGESLAAELPTKPSSLNQTGG